MFLLSACSLNMESAVEVVLFSRGWYDEFRSTSFIELSQHINMHYADGNFEPLGHIIDGGGCYSAMLPRLNDIDFLLCQFSFWFCKLVCPIMQQFMVGIGIMQDDSLFWCELMSSLTWKLIDRHELVISSSLMGLNVEERNETNVKVLLT